MGKVMLMVVDVRSGDGESVDSWVAKADSARSSDGKNCYG